MKKIKIILEPAAQRDLDNIACYYKSISPQLGKNFMSVAKANMQKLKTSAQANGVRYKNVRFASMKRFPYALHYILNNETNTAYIIGAFPYASDPNKSHLRSAE